MYTFPVLIVAAGLASPHVFNAAVQRVRSRNQVRPSIILLINWIAAWIHINKKPAGEKRGKTKKRIVKTLFRIDRMAQRVRAKSRASSHQPKLIQKKAQHMLHEDQVSRVLLEDVCYQRNINICFYIVFLGKLFIITPMRKQCSILDDGRIWSYRWYRIPVL